MWLMSSPGPDFGYQINLELLGLIAPLLKEAFNREYEVGDKNIDDFLNDMREFYGEWNSGEIAPKYSAFHLFLWYNSKTDKLGFFYSL